MQHGPCLEFSVADHQFVGRGEWAVAVVEDDESIHAEVCNFACSAALYNLFTHRLQAGSAQTGDDAGLTRLLCPCADDLQFMLKGNAPSLPLGLLEELMTGMQAEAGGKTTPNERALPLQCRGCVRRLDCPAPLESHSRARQTVASYLLALRRAQ